MKLFILGTSHIAKQSLKSVEKSFERFKPEIIALELDYSRAIALKNKVKRPKNITLLKMLGLKGFLFYMVGEIIQQKLGKIVNIQPGAEMLTALKLAEKNKLIVYFIDRDIQITLKRFSKYFRKREALRMVFDIVKGIFKKDELIRIDLTKLPSQELIDLVLKQTKSNYPSLYKVLIDERDKYMAHKLNSIAKLYPENNILAIVGAGHVKGIKRYLSKETFK